MLVVSVIGSFVLWFREHSRIYGKWSYATDPGQSFSLTRNSSIFARDLTDKRLFRTHWLSDSWLSQLF